MRTTILTALIVLAVTAVATTKASLATHWDELTLGIETSATIPCASDTADDSETIDDYLSDRVVENLADRLKFRTVEIESQPEYEVIRRSGSEALYVEYRLGTADELSSLQIPSDGSSPVVASDVRLLLTPRAGVDIEEVYGFPHEAQQEGDLEIELGDLEIDGNRSLLVRLTAERGTSSCCREHPSRHLIDARVRYKNHLTDARTTRPEWTRAQITRKRQSLHVRDESVDREVRTRVNRQYTIDAVRRAIEDFAAGDETRAYRRLENQHRRLDQMARYDTEDRLLGHLVDEARATLQGKTLDDQRQQLVNMVDETARKIQCQ